MFLELTSHYASDYSIIMSIVDMIPVALFLLTGIIVLKNLYGKIAGIYYSFISAGTIMVFVAGLLKAIWKLIASLGICDFVAFNLLFLPISAIGFTLFAVGLIGLFKKENNKALAIAFFPLFAMKEALEMKNTSLPFIIIQTLSCSALMLMLVVYSYKNNKKLACIFIVIAFITMWGMGGLAALDGKMDIVLWNWLEEIVNTVSQGALLVGVIYLFKENKGE